MVNTSSPMPHTALVRNGYTMNCGRLDGCIWKLAPSPAITAVDGQLSIDELPLFIFELSKNDHDEINSCPNTQTA